MGDPDSTVTGGTATGERPPGFPVPPPRGGRARLWLVVGAVVAVLVVIVVVVLAFSGADSEPAPAPPAAPPGTPTATGITPLTVAPPVRVHVPSIAADSSLIEVGVDENDEVEVPPLTQPMQAAWYRLGPAPGAVGPAVVLGHVNGSGRDGIFRHLDRVRPGQQVSVDRADGQTAVFTVRRTATVTKDSFPTQEVYGDTPGAELRLITCGGDFDPDEHSYESNVVVFAELTAVHRT